MKILIVEDEIMIARNLGQIISSIEHTTYEIAITYEEAVEKIPQLQPDLVLFDIHLGHKEFTGIDIATQLKTTYGFEIIYITAHFDDDTFAKASKTNPVNYIIKPFRPQQIQINLRLVLDQLEQQTSDEQAESSNKNIAQLSTTEIQILHLISLGLSSKHIAQQTNSAPKTISNHRANISKKLLLENINNSLLIWAINNKGFLKKAIT